MRVIEPESPGWDGHETIPKSLEPRPSATRNVMVKFFAISPSSGRRRAPARSGVAHPRAPSPSRRRHRSGLSGLGIRLVPRTRAISQRDNLSDRSATRDRAVGALTRDDLRVRTVVAEPRGTSGSRVVDGVTRPHALPSVRLGISRATTAKGNLKTREEVSYETQ